MYMHLNFRHWNFQKITCHNLDDIKIIRIVLEMLNMETTYIYIYLFTISDSRYSYVSSYEFLSCKRGFITSICQQKGLSQAFDTVLFTFNKMTNSYAVYLFIDSNNGLNVLFLFLKKEFSACMTKWSYIRDELNYIQLFSITVLFIFWVRNLFLQNVYLLIDTAIASKV